MNVSVLADILILFGTGVSLQYFLSLDENIAPNPRGTYLSVSFGWGYVSSRVRLCTANGAVVRQSGRRYGCLGRRWYLWWTY